MPTPSNPRYCMYCGNDRAWHRTSYSRCRYGFYPQPKPSCRVCGSGFDPAKSGRDDCCYRHRMDS